MHKALRPFKPSKSSPWDFDAAAHLWRRAAFGASEERIEKTLRLSPKEAVARLVAGPKNDRATAELEQIYPTVLGTNSADNVRSWLVMRAVRCGHQLREKMAIFWHGHFATSLLKVKDVIWMARQYRLFLDHGLGSFAVLLDRVTRDPAMIRWLDNETNAKGRPNENFARELFELFTLGDGNYSEKDIQEAARAFTGWHILDDQYHFSAALHDYGEKEVLGEKGEFNGDDIGRIALRQEACGRFLAHKLLAFFVTPEPAPSVVAAFGKEIRTSDYDIAAALELLLESNYFFARTSRRKLVKSPLEYVVGAARAFGTKLNAEATVPALREMGQELLAPPNVKGWPGHRKWINTATWLTRTNAARAFANSFDPRYGGADALDHYGRALFGRPLDGSARQLILSSGANRNDIVHALLSLPEAHLA